MPLPGSFLSFRRDMVAFLKSTAEQGDVVPFRMLGRRYVLVNDPHWVEQILVRQHARTPKGWRLGLLGPALGNGLLTARGERWREQRRWLQPYFGRLDLDRQRRVVRRSATTRLKQWQPGKSVDVYREATRIGIDAITDALFGRADCLPHPAIVGFADGWMQQFEDLLQRPWRAFLPSRLRKRTAEHHARLCRAIDGQIEAQKQMLGSSGCLLQVLLGIQTRSPGVMDDAQIREHLLTILFTGHETLGMVIACSLLMLANNRPGTPGRHGVSDSWPNRREWLTGVVKETLRLYPPAWFLMRRTTEKTVMQGTVIPRNTPLVFCSYTAHRDPRYFSRPEEFRPERWRADRRVRPGAYYPFGLGPRACIGKQLAMVEAVTALETILDRFRVLPDPSYRFALRPSFTLRPAGGIRVVPALAQSRTAFRLPLHGLSI